MDYLIRSVCPYTSMCVSGACAVVCPMVSYDPDARVAKVEPVTCSSDAQCDCSGYLPGHPGRCACISDRCVMVLPD